MKLKIVINNIIFQFIVLSYSTANCLEWFFYIQFIFIKIEYKENKNLKSLDVRDIHRLVDIIHGNTIGFTRTFNKYDIIIT